MHWFSLIFGALAIFTVAAVIFEQVRAPAGEGPLVGMRIGDALVAILFMAPIMVAFAQSLQYALTGA